MVMITRPGQGPCLAGPGVAVTDLRPSGKAEVDGTLLEVLADGVFLDKGEPVRVISDDGMGVIVKRVKD